MSGDEVFALIVSCIIGLVGWRTWLGGLLLLEPLSRKLATQFLGWGSPLVAAGALYFVLARWSSHDVRDNPTYIFFYLAMGFGWAGLWNWILPYAGLSFRDDALELNNDAAGIAISGSLLGATLAFAGANIGDGPGWWVVVFCAMLSTGLMLVLWIIGAKLTRVHEFITIDRDTASGWRAAGYFIGAGLILGRAVAGDWHSTQQTVIDFLARGWPVLILWAVAFCFDKISKPTPQRPALNPVLFGALPSLLLMGMGVGNVLIQGAW
ncbi:MAG TPA: hypothetical protein VMF08_11945 [Candidatus Sulfotelmatobacter sp.]|nr:hypothetical protein [Candidatus Sulfotelmatobacter sp.]